MTAKKKAAPVKQEAESTPEVEQKTPEMTPVRKTPKPSAPNLGKGHVVIV